VTVIMLTAMPIRTTATVLQVAFRFQSQTSGQTLGSWCYLSNPLPAKLFEADRIEL
jgi:hypothetical protein